MELLRWTERLEVVGLEPLGLAHCLSRRTVYSHVARLEAAGLVERIYDRNGTLVAITRAGRVTVRPEHPDPRAATQSLAGGALASHARATSWVAARATLRDLRWVSDREMRALPGWQVQVIWMRAGRHRPDLGVTANGGRVAVEVELTAKAHKRLHAILAGYRQEIGTGRLAGVLYVVEQPLVRAAVEREAHTVGLDRRRLRILDLAEVQQDTRRLAATELALPATAPAGAR
jgi:DNA-binding transcriptional ArsR family regulator